MFSFLKRFTNNLIQKSTHIHHEPINKVSIVILIIVDIFVLINVFTGLDSIAQWPLSPTEEYPCFLPYQNYHSSPDKGTFEFNFNTISNLIEENKYNASLTVDNSNRLGKVSPICDVHTRLAKAVNSDQSVALKTEIEQINNEISRLDQQIQTLKSQYDSTLLEKIAGQERKNSINQVAADKIKGEIDQKTSQIKDKEKQIKNKKTALLELPNVKKYLETISFGSDYFKIKTVYDQASFWYPNKQLFLQTLFLLPLIILTYLWHSHALKKDRGIQALLSWHLLLIFCIPLIIKFFEFIQFGNLFAIVIDFITVIFGGLVFISSYLLILIIPLCGLGLIQLLQRFVFNPRVQAKKRIQKVRCINCNTKLRLTDDFCFHCGFEQYIECPNCQAKTHKFTNFCPSCGHKLEQ